MKGLNAPFRHARDGDRFGAIELSMLNRVERRLGIVYVFWPLAVFQTVHKDWNITHAPSGLHIRTLKTRVKAFDLVERLRAAADFEFVSDNGRKARRARKAVQGILPPRWGVG